jgi:hypothetical protein
MAARTAAVKRVWSEGLKVMSSNPMDFKAPLITPAA